MQVLIEPLPSINVSPWCVVEPFKLTVELSNQELEVLGYINKLKILDNLVDEKWGWQHNTDADYRHKSWQLFGDTTEQERVCNVLTQDLLRLLKLAKEIKQALSSKPELVEPTQQGLTTEGLAKIAYYAGLEEESDDI